MYMTLMMTSFKNRSTVCQNIFAFFMLLLIWFIIVEYIKEFLEIFLEIKQFMSAPAFNPPRSHGISKMTQSGQG